MTEAPIEPVATFMDRGINGTWKYRLFSDRLEVHWSQPFSGTQTLQFALASLSPVHGFGRRRLPPFWTGLWITIGSIGCYLAVAWLQDNLSRAPLHPAALALFAALVVTGVFMTLMHRRVVSAVYFAFEAGPQAISFTSNGLGEAAFSEFVAAVQKGIEDARQRGPTRR
jgi:hypothetical protein